MTTYTIRAIDFANKNRAIEYLRQHEDYTMFLMGNLQQEGPHLTQAPNSGQFKLLEQGSTILAVFCLCKRGSLLVHMVEADLWLIDPILKSCAEESIDIQGVLAVWDQASMFWQRLKDTGIIRIESYVAKEILYRVELTGRSFAVDHHTRLLTRNDFCRWQELRRTYLSEQTIPNDLSDEEMRIDFARKIKNNIMWGYFAGDELVSIGELNAQTLDLGQVGGVFTLPSYRGRGFAKKLMLRILHDSQQIHHLRKIVIFTDEDNIAARRVYESLEVEVVGSYGMLFGQS